MKQQLTTPSCPVPTAGSTSRITLAHGEGGLLTRRLLDERIFPALDDVRLPGAGDATILARINGQLVFTTDSFVVSPLVFPGGDIGKLCVFGTVNDLAVAGARPLWISLALILEEGLPLDVLEAVLASVASAAREAGVFVAAGDTKVVPRGAVDGLFINTAGVGELIVPRFAGPAALECGDALIVTGAIGQHGVAVMAARELPDLQPSPMSDCGSLLPAVEALRAANLPVVCLRDATRGGVAAVLHEWAADCGHALAVDEDRLPVSTEVRGVCELLGLDPLHVANEGTMVVAVRQGNADRAIEVLRRVGVSRLAAVVGRVQARQLSPVLVKRGLGRYLPLDEPLGAPLPRIC